MNNEINNNYVLDPKIPEYRRNISLIGLGLLVMIALNYSSGMLFSHYLVKKWPILGDTTKIWYWLADIVAQYVISIPAGILIIRKATMPTNNPIPTGKPNMLVYIPVVFTGMYAGSMISQFVNNVTDTLFNVTSSTKDPHVTGIIDTAAVIIIFAVLAPIMEELFFRKCLIDALRPYGEKTAIIISSLAFALAHRNIAQMFYAFISGIALGYVYLRSGKIKYGIMIHSLVNTIGSVIPIIATDFLIDQNLYNEFMDYCSEIYANNSSLTGEIAQKMLEQLGTLLPGLSILIICNVLLEGLALAGLVLLLMKRRNINFNKGEITIRREDIGYVFFEAPGMVAFILLSVVLIVLSYFK